MKTVEDYKRDIKEQFRRMDARPNNVVFLNIFYWGILRNASAEELKNFRTAIFDLITQGFVKYDNSNPGFNMLRLTTEGYINLYPQVDDTKITRVLANWFAPLKVNDYITTREMWTYYFQLLNPLEQDRIPVICNRLIEQGYLGHSNRPTERFILTQKGYDKIHDNKEAGKQKLDANG